jgi:hypothetical protein
MVFDLHFTATIIGLSMFMCASRGEAIFDVEDGVELRESQGFKIKDLNKAQQLAEENRDLIIEKWNEYLG